MQLLSYNFSICCIVMYRMNSLFCLFFACNIIRKFPMNCFNICQQVWTLVVAYLLVVIFYWTPESSKILRPLSIPVWIALTFHLTTIVGVFRVPLLLVLGVMMAVGCVSTVTESTENPDEGRWGCASVHVRNKHPYHDS